MTAVLCPSGWDVDKESELGRAFPVWRRDPTAPADLPRLVLDWVAATGRPCYVRAHGWSYLVPEERLFEQVRAVHGRVSPWIVVTASPDTGHMRRALFDDNIVLHCFDVDLGWHGEVAELRGMLL